MMTPIIYFTTINRRIPCARRLHSHYSRQDGALPFEEIPTLALSDIFSLINPFRQTSLKQTLENNFAKYGNIYKFQTPGNKRFHQVYICDPSDGEELLRNDGPYPHISGFDFFVAYRSKVRGDLYQGSQVELQKIDRRSCTITENATSRAFTRLKAATTTFTFKTLIRHLLNRIVF